MEIHMNLTVSQRIWGGFICITLLLLLIGGNSLFRIANINNSAQQVNQLSLPALEESSELQVEFILMSKAAQASFYTTSNAELEPIKKSLQERKVLFDRSQSQLKQVVANNAQLSKSSLDVEQTYNGFIASVESLLNDKAAELRLNKEYGYILNIVQGDYEIIDYELGGVENAIKIYQAQ